VGTLFYSWQSDSPSKTNRGFIKDATERAIKSVNRDLELEEALRLDQDTQGVPGTPEIANTILKKIDECDIFLCDLTIVAKTADGQQLPNPNVLIELGYAMKAMGAEHIIAVLNEEYGPVAAGLPFDLQHRRWPIRYSISAEASAEGRNEQKKILTSSLEEAIRSVLASSASRQNSAVATSALQFLAAEPKDGKARFRARGEPLGMHLDPSPFRRRDTNEVFLSNGPAMWLRLMPTVGYEKIWTADELEKCAIQGSSILLDPFYGEARFLREQDGFGVYAFNGEGSPETPSVAFAFETGEIWSIDTTLMDIDHNLLLSVEIEKQYTRCLESYGRFLQCLKIPVPYRWIAGLEGVKMRELAIPPPPNHMNIGHGPVCRADLIMEEGTYDTRESAAAALRPFFDLIFRKCGTSRPDYLGTTR
jgi:hypothetical protein